MIDGSRHSDVLEGDGGANTFWGDAGHDVLKGFGGADTLSGGAGGDQLSGGEGADLSHGGADFDFAVYADAASGVLVDLSNMARNTARRPATCMFRSRAEGLGPCRPVLRHVGLGRLLRPGRRRRARRPRRRRHARRRRGLRLCRVLGLRRGRDGQPGLRHRHNAGDAAGRRSTSTIEGLQGSNHADTLTGNVQGNTLYG